MTPQQIKQEEGMALGTIAELQRRGIEAFWDYPGVINVPLGADWVLAVGTANGPWGYDVVDNATGVCEDTSEWAQDTPDAVGLAERIEAVYRKYRKG